jgi:glycosyltransferase involved in cell wall biosynthesis
MPIKIACNVRKNERFGKVRSPLDEQATWIVARLGAAMHYAVPRILHRAGRLERFYTDFYAGVVARSVLSSIPKSWRSPAVSRALGRVAKDLPHERVRSYPLLGLEYYVRQALTSDAEVRNSVFLWAGRKFGKLVTRDGFRNARAVYAFNTAALEILRAAKQRGLITVLEQTIAPRALEEELIAEEHRRFPNWEPVRNQGASTIETIEREREEWQSSNLILCGSEFVRQGVAHCGGPIEKCVVVPYGVDAILSKAERPFHNEPLRILSVGEAGLRKGISYAAETARLLGGAADFRWIGSIRLLPKGRSHVEPHVKLMGAIPRNLISPYFEWADVFFLPSVCEGSATVTYEALMSGLPVITTPNTGSVVTDGVNGFIVAARDSQAMAERLERLHLDRNLLSKMQKAARDSTEIASLECYERRLLGALSNAIAPRRSMADASYEVLDR